MQDYVRPTLRENPDSIIIHVGTNDLASNTPAEKVAESIIDLASTLKSDSCSVAISSITMRNDKRRNKIAQVNRSLKRLCQEKNFQLINYENTITERHLNGSKLHLNKSGTTILSNNFTETISNSIQSQFIFHSLNNRRNSGILLMNIKLRYLTGRIIRNLSAGVILINLFWDI